MVKKKTIKTRKRKKVKAQVKKKELESILKKIVLILVLSFICAAVISFVYGLINKGATSDDKSNKPTAQSTNIQENTSTEVGEDSLPQDNIEIANFEIGQTLSAEYVYLTKPGYIVVYEYPDGKKGSIIGKSRLLKEGQRKKVLIQLTRSTTMNEVLFAALYIDDGDGIYEVPGDDRAIIDEKGKEVGVSFAIGGSGAESPRI